MKSIYYLEMDLRARDSRRLAQDYLALIAGGQVTPEQYRDIYLRVGGPWGWQSRLAWSDAAITAHLLRKDRSIRLLQDGGDTIGFFEIEVISSDLGDIRYFGLVPEAIGCGWGTRFLEAAIGCAEAIGLKCLLIKTSNTDHPNALHIYRKAGFGLVEIRQFEAEGF